MAGKYKMISSLLITGVNGFIGSHLLEAFEKEYRIFGISRFPSKKKNITQLNIQNFDKLEAFVREKNISIIIHLAGQSLVENGQENPRETFATNVQGTLNVLEVARKQKNCKVIIASTAHVYGSQNPPARESDIPLPSRPYETSKVCADLIAQSYFLTYALPVWIPRFVNIYGPGDMNHQRLIPTAICSILEGNAPEIWNGNTIRDYMYIDDVVKAFRVMIDYDPRSVLNGELPIVNFGTNQRFSVKDIVNRIIKISGKNISPQFNTEHARAGEIIDQYVTVEKAKEILKWEAEISVDDGLQRTYEWYEKNRKRGK